MIEINWTEIIMAVVGMMSGWATWFLDRRKHRQEVKNLEAEAKAQQAETEKRYMELAMMYVDEFTKNIVRPLEKRVDELTNEVKALKDELGTVKENVCYRDGCAHRISVL